MSDRELLEGAARAAGIEIEGDADKLVVFPGHFAGGFSVFNDQGGSQLWNPLQDDGDALRLAVKLGLDVCIDTDIKNNPYTHVIGFYDNTSSTVDAIERHGDPYAATRRAIVRAAAAIHDAKGQHDQN